MKTVRLALMAALASLTAGCGAFSNKNLLAATPIMPEGYGQVVVSGGAPQHCISFSTSVQIAPLGSKYLKHIISAINVDVYVSKSDFADHQGNLYVLNLPEGDYEMYPYPGNPHIIFKSVPLAAFHVQQGKTTYIGEYYIPFRCAMNRNNEIRDEEERDLSLLRRLNPAFEKVVISKDLAKFVGRLP